MKQTNSRGRSGQRQQRTHPQRRFIPLGHRTTATSRFHICVLGARSAPPPQGMPRVLVGSTSKKTKCSRKTSTGIKSDTLIRWSLFGLTKQVRICQIHRTAPVFSPDCPPALISGFVWSLALWLRNGGNRTGSRDCSVPVSSKATTQQGAEVSSHGPDPNWDRRDALESESLKEVVGACFDLRPDSWSLVTLERRGCANIRGWSDPRFVLTTPTTTRQSTEPEVCSLVIPSVVYL